MKRGEEIMKCLKIEENKGWYTTDGKKWKNIDEINKDDIMIILDKVINDEEFEMDEYTNRKIGNPAHDIIYSNLYSKLKELFDNKTRFKDQSENMYKEAIDKYRKLV